VFYDPERAKLVDELTAASVALRETAEAVNKGEGTAGLLVRDPQLYEDIRALVGGAQRNALLRAYIRATIAKEKDETSGPFEGPEGAN
jgi:phospholipid/cholesterol/gamma-HCH transport system substrate-binding protein